jgi:Polyketide cyclase / dehydrase and lipid transport
MADDTYTVTRSATINAAPERLYQQLVDFHRWTSWSPWEDIDPGMTRTYSGADSGVGAVYAWSGNRKAGQGRMEIVETTVPSLVRVDLVFEKPFKARNDTAFTIEPAPIGSQVTWTMTGRKTIATKVMGLFKSMDAMIGPDFEKGLARLKAGTEEPGVG